MGPPFTVHSRILSKPQAVNDAPFHWHSINLLPGQLILLSLPSFSLLHDRFNPFHLPVVTSARSTCSFLFFFPVSSSSSSLGLSSLFSPLSSPHPTQQLTAEERNVASVILTRGSGVRFPPSTPIFLLFLRRDKNTVNTMLLSLSLSSSLFLANGVSVDVFHI